MLNLRKKVSRAHNLPSINVSRYSSSTWNSLKHILWKNQGNQLRIRWKNLPKRPVSGQITTMEADVLPYNSVENWKCKLILYMHGDSMLSYSIQYQIMINDFSITSKYTKCQLYCNVLKVAEAVKSFLNVVQNLNYT